MTVTIFVLLINFAISSYAAPPAAVLEKPNDSDVCKKLTFDGSQVRKYFFKEERSKCTMCLTSNEASPSTTSKFERLPKFAKPTHYKIFLTPSLTTFKFNGEETITVSVTDSTNFLKLHSSELEIQEISAELGDGKKFESLSHTYDNVLEMIKVEFPETITPQTLKLNIKFTGTHNDKMLGFYRSSYKDSEGKEKYLVSTQFESTYARKAFPCFDEPTFRAIFEVSLKVDKSYTALSNTEVVSIEDGPNGTKIYKFAPTISMSSYLVAFIVGDFDYIEGKSDNNTLVRVYTVPGKKVQATFALEVGIKCLNFFNEWFDFPYPVSKMDMIAIPDFSMGAMENTGLLTYREVALLMDPAKSSVKQKSYIALVIAHEIAHQWFGNLVTHAWWNQLWLKEGFASFMEYVMVGANYPEFNIWQQFLNDEVTSGMALDSLRSSHPIEVPINNPSELEEIYDAITYQKSNSILRMLYNYLGEPTFQKALRTYIKKHQYSNTVTQDLWNALTEASGQNIQEMMDTWTKQIGFPLVTVSQTIEGNKRVLTFKQTRFIADGGESETPQSWYIPISISTTSSKDQPKYKFLMTKPEQTFTIDNIESSEWIKINTGTTGFYRVQYSDEMLNSLFKAISDGTLPVLDRFGIASDVFALVKAGKLNAVNYLKLFEASKNEEDFVVRSALELGIGSISNVLSRFEDQEILKRFNAFVIKNLEPLANKLGWEAKAGEDGKIAQLRGLILNRLARSKHQPTIETARKIFNNHYDNKVDIDPNLRNAIYFVIGREDGAEGLKKLQHILETVNFSEVERSCLLAMSQTQDFDRLEGLFEYGFVKNKIRSQDLMGLFSGASTTKLGQDFIYQYFFKNMVEILKKFGNANSSLFQRCLKLSGENIASEEKAVEFEKFFKCNVDSVTQATLDRPIRQTTESMRNNYQLLKRNGESINQFLVGENI
uniref:Aminopeptidase n=1 Tax=Parastrongyloides trichosuri TaxID=131310 RepID=A0A0N4ZAG9_PARTI